MELPFLSAGEIYQLTRKPPKTALRTRLVAPLGVLCRSFLRK